ncbi:MAG TPA: DUF2752 domain-containing protein [Vicinamibacteria bacterium]|nr:DUF2752 domain-containing protein [Vicinamibacteria bacterium]
MSELPPATAARPLVRVWAQPGAPPTGLVFGAISALAGLAVSVLHLDRLPLTLCLFKGMTGLPCPTCGGTRALGRLFAGDLAGAVLMNPLAALGALLVFGWAIADLVLLPTRRALALELHPRLAQVLRATAVVLLLLNWAFLLAVRR